MSHFVLQTSKELDLESYLCLQGWNRLLKK